MTDAQGVQKPGKGDMFARLDRFEQILCRFFAKAAQMLQVFQAQPVEVRNGSDDLFVDKPRDYPVAKAVYIHRVAACEMNDRPLDLSRDSCG